ncbi:MAG: hypothetical protein HY904_02675 [Deltaproteobacteria bacterium]|nr:hypothetical protein [Deltaproteobacteria bacterium]
MSALLLACLLAAPPADNPPPVGSPEAPEAPAVEPERPPMEQEPASGSPWLGWGTDVALGTSVGLVLGVGVPLVLGAAATGGLGVLVWQMLQLNTGWQDLAAVALAIIGMAFIVPGTLLLVPLLETAFFVASASASSVARRVVPPLRARLDRRDSPGRRVLRTALAPVAFALAALPVLLVSLFVVGGGFSLVPLTFAITNTISLGVLGEAFLPIMLGGAASVALGGVLLHGLLAVTVRPALAAVWQYVDGWIAAPP